MKILHHVSRAKLQIQ